MKVYCLTFLSLFSFYIGDFTFLLCTSIVQIYDPETGSFNERNLTVFRSHKPIGLKRRYLPFTPNGTPGNIFANLPTGKPFTQFDDEDYLNKVNKNLPPTPILTPATIRIKTPKLRLSDMSAILEKSNRMIDTVDYNDLHNNNYDKLNNQYSTEEMKKSKIKNMFFSIKKNKFIKPIYELLNKIR
jgi:hypothetical protein